MDIHILIAYLPWA